MAVYLVDFENVSSAGISGIQKLTKEDKVYIFYTVNASTMSFAAHLNLLSSPAEVVYYNVASGGKNALDFQLASFLGYLICQGKEKKFCIISNDRGFEYVKTFWERNGVSADITISGAPSINRSLLPTEKPFSARIQQSANEPSEPAIEEKPSAQPLKPAAPAQAPAQNRASAPAAETAPQTKPARPGTAAKAPAATQEKAAENALQAKPAQSKAAAKTPAAAQDKAAESTAPKRRGRPPKNAKAPETPKTAAKTDAPKAAAKAEAPKPEDRPEAPKTQNSANTAGRDASKSRAPVSAEPPQSLRHALAKAGVTDEHDISCVMDLLENTGNKQQFYRGILKLFGMERGVEIYKVVRPEYSNLTKLLNP